MHYGFELTGFTRSLAWLFPVNESPWEHLKLIFFPILFWGLIEHAILQRTATTRAEAPRGLSNYWFARLLGAYVAVMITVTSWSLQHWLRGRSILAIDIAMMYVGLLVSALLCWLLITGPARHHKRWLKRCGVSGMTVLLLGFCLFTYCVPLALLWKDRPRQTFGIIEAHILFDRHLSTQCFPAPSLPGLVGFFPLVFVGVLLAVCFFLAKSPRNT